MTLVLLAANTVHDWSLRSWALVEDTLGCLIFPVFELLFLWESG